MTSNLGKSGSP
ncbi:hypothetical protein VCHE16_3777, partial [Vibrio paracholerae HE-16]